MKLQRESFYPFQYSGSEWLAPKTHALLADEMGLGKSAQAIRAADLQNIHDILIICPSSVKVNWEREFEKFSTMARPCTIIRSGRDSIPTSGVVIVSYDMLDTSGPSNELLRRAEAEEEEAEALKKKAQRYVGLPDHGPATASEAFSKAMCVVDRTLRTIKAIKEVQKQHERLVQAIKATRRPLLILDEAHYLKNRTSNRSKVIYGRHIKFACIASQADRVWCLSGTPCPNYADELWTHLYFAKIVNVSYWDFTFRYCTGFESKFGFKITGHQNVPELKALLKDYMLRRTKEQVMPDLPPLVFQTVSVDKSPVQLDPNFYEAIKSAGSTSQFMDELKVADQTLRAALDAVAEGETPNEDRLQVLRGFDKNMMSLRRYIGMAKLPAICEIIEQELESKAIDKIVLFAVHQCVIEYARDFFHKKYKAVSLYGKTPDVKRQANIDKFRNDKKCRVFVGNIQAAGVGVNGLQNACHEVAFLEQDWVPGNNAQAAMRVHRIGQTRPVRVRIFSLYKSVDEQVAQTLTRKIRELTKIF